MSAAAKSLQSNCPTLCNPVDGSPPGSTIRGILQARTLEWVAIAFSNAWKWKVKGEVTQLCPTLATPWTAAYQAPPSMGFSRQKYWSGVSLPSPLWIPIHVLFCLILKSTLWWGSVLFSFFRSGIWDSERTISPKSHNYESLTLVMQSRSVDDKHWTLNHCLSVPRIIYTLLW